MGIGSSCFVDQVKEKQKELSRKLKLAGVSSPKQPERPLEYLAQETNG